MAPNTEATIVPIVTPYRLGRVLDSNSMMGGSRYILGSTKGNGNVVQTVTTMMQPTKPIVGNAMILIHKK
jgi:hypothetical protein